MHLLNSEVSSACSISSETLWSHYMLLACCIFRPDLPLHISLVILYSENLRWRWLKNEYRCLLYKEIRKWKHCREHLQQRSCMYICMTELTINTLVAIWYRILVAMASSTSSHRI